MPGPKKDRTNGKVSAGGVAAVTKHGKPSQNSRHGNGGLQGFLSNPSPPLEPDQADEIKATAPPLAREHSPMLDAMSNTSFATSTSPTTGDWTRALDTGFQAGSPGNLISLAGESPPTAPSSYEEDRRGLRSGWSSPQPKPAYGHYPFAQASTCAPKTASHKRPLSFLMEGRFSPEKHHQPLAMASRRSSIQSPYPQVRSVSNPPLPHQPQPHFYGAPDVDLDLQPQSGLQAGARGYYFGFDTLPTPSPDCLARKNTVVLAGFEGGLEVQSVSKRGLERLPGIRGLRGGVVHAKILPWMDTACDVFPLVVLVIHGPSLPLPSSGPFADGHYDAVSAERSEAMAPDGASKEAAMTRMSAASFGSYQTTVEVYSLKTGRLVTVLLEAPKIALQTPMTSPTFAAPPPAGALSVKAESGYMAVASGETGECWLYRQVCVAEDLSARFACLGKIWTTSQQPLKKDGQPQGERVIPPVLSRPRPSIATVSVNERWLAYCPAAPSTQFALGAIVTVPKCGRAPGLTTMAPPQLPAVNCDVDLPVSGSVMNRIMRDATQEVIQGAKWVGKQSLQAWNSYWNPQSKQTPPSPPMNGWPGPPSRPDKMQFPPTHGSMAPSASPKEPGFVSIVDLETVGTLANVYPVATFVVPHGCSFLSLSPTGSSLFTASGKGDVQTVWDLMRIQDTKSSPLQTLPTTSPLRGPRVRQTVQFSRMTVTRIVDVAWTRPGGECAAMVTERGTVHLLALPSAAFAWPPPRRRMKPQEPKTVAEGPASAVAMASSAFSTVRDAARPLMNRPRRSSSNVPQLTGGGLGDYASHGGKAIAASISHSLGKTGNAINQLRHTRENRVSLPTNSLTAPGPSCAAWLRGAKDHHLFVLHDGLVRAFPNRGHQCEKSRRVCLARIKDFKFPPLPDDVLSATVKALIDPDEYLDLADKDSDVSNHGAFLEYRPPRPLYKSGAQSSIPLAEIESSAPYQPFHTDARIALSEYAEPDGRDTVPTPSVLMLLEATSLDDPCFPGEAKRSKKRRAMQLREGAQAQGVEPSSRYTSRGGEETWAFGQAVETAKLDLGFSELSEDEALLGSLSFDTARALPASAMKRVLRTDDDDQIIVTTRRWRVAAGRGATVDENGDGFFEDDCEVLEYADQRL